MTVTITPGFWNPPEDPGAFPSMMGGVRIAVDGLVVTGGPAPVTLDDDLYDARGRLVEPSLTEFAGEFLSISINGLITAIEPFLRDEAERHREYTADMMGEPGLLYVVLSRIDGGDHVRVAASPEYDEWASQVPLDAQVGAAADPVAIARELVDVLATMAEYVEGAFTDYERVDFDDEIETYRSNRRSDIEELERLIDEAE